MGRLIGLVAVIAVLAPAALGGAASPPAPLLGVAWAAGNAQLTRLDPSSLLPVGPRLSVGTHTQGWSTSSDGRMLVLADERGELLFVDAHTLRRAGTHTLPREPNVVATAWLGSRLVAVDENLDAVDVTVIDARHRVVHARTFTSSFLASGHTATSVVLLLAPRFHVGPVTVLRIGNDGRIASTRLTAIRGGFEGLVDPRSAKAKTVRPAFVVDPESGRALVVAADGTAASVDIRTMRSTIHHLGLRGGPLLAKEFENGPIRDGVWLGNGLLAVAGWNGHHGARPTPAGAELVDTRNWTAHMLDPRATAVARAGDTIVTAHTSWQGGTGGGLRGYALDGTLRFHALGDASLSLMATTSARVVVVDTADGSTSIVDASSGAVLRTDSSDANPVMPLAAG
jgi:hypothetical protein